MAADPDFAVSVDRLIRAIDRACDAYSRVSGAFHSAYYGVWTDYEDCKPGGSCPVNHWRGDPNARYKGEQ